MPPRLRHTQAHSQPIPIPDYTPNRLRHTKAHARPIPDYIHTLQAPPYPSTHAPDTRLHTQQVPPYPSTHTRQIPDYTLCQALADQSTRAPPAELSTCAHPILDNTTPRLRHTEAHACPRYPTTRSSGSAIPKHTRARHSTTLYAKLHQTQQTRTSGRPKHTRT